MIELTGHCPLCDHEFGSEDSEATCPACGIGLRKHVPLVRTARAWYWEFTGASIGQLHALWVQRENNNE